MAALRFLAERLGKQISYFLDEATVTSPNTDVMASARKCFADKNFSGVLNALEQYREPDKTFDQERRLLEAKCCLALAGQAITDYRMPYARELLIRAAKAGQATCYYGPELERERLLLLAQSEPETEIQLHNDDIALLIRAKTALAAGNPARSAQLLDAVEERTYHWHYLRGETYFLERNFACAADCYQQAESAYPKETAPRLEHCFRELDDYKMAYYYACKLRDTK